MLRLFPAPPNGRRHRTDNGRKLRVLFVVDGRGWILICLRVRGSLPLDVAGNGTSAFGGRAEVVSQCLFRKMELAIFDGMVDAQVLAESEPPAFDPEAGADQLELDEEVNKAGPLQQERVSGCLQEQAVEIQIHLQKLPDDGVLFGK